MSLILVTLAAGWHVKSRGLLSGGIRITASGATKPLLLRVLTGGGLAASLGAKPENGPADCGRSMF